MGNFLLDQVRNPQTFETKLTVIFRNETKMPFLRENLWIRDQPPRSHQTTTPGNPCALPLLPPLIHAQQHRAEAHTEGAQAPDQPQDDTNQVWVDQSDARSGVSGAGDGRGSSRLGHSRRCAQAEAQATFEALTTRPEVAPGPRPPRPLGPCRGHLRNF